MRDSRRSFVIAAVRIAGVLMSARVATAQHPQPKPSPNAPTNQNAPEGFEHYPSGSQTDGPQPRFNPALITAMVQQLYQSSLELKQETEKTNLQTMLPADFVKRAQQIEKLAKTIRQRVQN